MIFYKISFEGAFNHTFSNVDIDYVDGYVGELDFRYKTYVKIRGIEIPIRKSLIGSFGNEFIMAIHSGEENYILKFMISPDGGYMVKHCGSRSSYNVTRFLNLGSDNTPWRNPCLGEEK